MGKKHISAAAALVTVAGLALWQFNDSDGAVSDTSSSYPSSSRSVPSSRHEVARIENFPFSYEFPPSNDRGDYSASETARLPAPAAETIPFADTAYRMEALRLGDSFYAALKGGDVAGAEEALQEAETLGVGPIIQDADFDEADLSDIHFLRFPANTEFKNVAFRGIHCPVEAPDSRMENVYFDVRPGFDLDAPGAFLTAVVIEGKGYNFGPQSARRVSLPGAKIRNSLIADLGVVLDLKDSTLSRMRFRNAVLWNPVLTTASPIVPLRLWMSDGAVIRMDEQIETPPSLWAEDLEPGHYLYTYHEKIGGLPEHPEAYFARYNPQRDRPSTRKSYALSQANRMAALLAVMERTERWGSTKNLEALEGQRAALHDLLKSYRRYLPRYSTRIRPARLAEAEIQVLMPYFNLKSLAVYSPVEEYGLLKNVQLQLGYGFQEIWGRTQELAQNITAWSQTPPTL